VRERLAQPEELGAAGAASTKVLRSIGSGTMRVLQRLSPARAITLCWIAKSSIASTAAARHAGMTGPVSMFVGSGRLPTKPAM
jgi:hypothetical protein